MKTHCLDCDTEGGLSFPFFCMVSVLAEHILSSLKVGYLSNRRHQYVWFSHKEAMGHSVQHLKPSPWVPGSRGLRATSHGLPFLPRPGHKLCHENGNIVSGTCRMLRGLLWFFPWLLFLGAPFHYLVSLCCVREVKMPLLPWAMWYKMKAEDIYDSCLTWYGFRWIYVYIYMISIAIPIPVSMSSIYTCTNNYRYGHFHGLVCTLLFPSSDYWVGLKKMTAQ